MATLAISGGKGYLENITVVTAGADANAAHILTVTEPSGAARVISFTTDGSGGGTVKFTRSMTGKYNYSLRTAVAGVVATGTSHG